MKALFVIDNLSTGGAQRQMVSLALALKQRGHSIQFIRYVPGGMMEDTLTSAGIPIITVVKTSHLAINVIRELRHTLQKGDFDVVLAYLPPPNMYAILARLLLPHSARLVISERISYPDHLSVLYRAVFQFYRLADRMVVNSYAQLDDFRLRFPWLSQKLMTIYNGLDLDKFYYTPMGEDIAPLKIVVVASAIPRKNGLCLVEALKILREEHGIYPRVSWVGEREFQIPELKDYVAKMDEAIHLSGLSGQWHWLGQRSNIVEILHAHDLLVLPSYLEGLPNAICEAMACGRPVIASDVYENPRLVQEGVSGFLFDWRSPRSLADAIIKYNNISLEGRNRMGVSARKFVEEHLSIARMADEYEQLFNILAG